MTNDTCTYCARCIDAGALGVLADLLPLIAPDRLGDVRGMLRDEGRWSGASPAQRLQVADLRGCRSAPDGG